MTLADAAAVLADSNSCPEDRILARDVVTAAIVEIVAKRPTTASKLRKTLKKAGVVVHTTTIRSLAARAARKGLLALRIPVGVSHVETEYLPV